MIDTSPVAMDEMCADCVCPYGDHYASFDGASTGCSGEQPGYEYNEPCQCKGFRRR